MKVSAFYIVCGSVALGSLAVGLIGAFLAKRKEKNNHGDTFRDLYEDNAPTDRELADEYSRDCGSV